MKVRIVYDALAKVANSPSLNDCLLKGPKFNQLIFDLLERFRLMVSVDEDDRNLLRFVWVDTIEDPSNLKVY